MQKVGRVRLDSLTSLRFFAAVLVVASHSTRDLVPVPVLSGILSNGSAGVGFFFALSGFVLTWSHRPGDTARAFYRRRFARVYPLHIVTYLLAVPVLVIAGSNMQGSSINTRSAILSPVLLQAWSPDDDTHFGMNAPSWSLSNEAFFYLLFPLLIPVMIRLGRGALAAVLVLIPIVSVAGALLAPQLLGPVAGQVLYTNPAWRLLGFVAGIALALALRSGMRSPVSTPGAVALALVGFLALVGLHRVADTYRVDVLSSHGMTDALMMPLFLLLIAAAAQSDLDRTSGWLRHTWLVRLGEWSFALYLTHWLLIDLIVGVRPQIRELHPVKALVANALVIALAIAVSAAFYYAVERPLEKRLRAARPRPEESRARGRSADDDASRPTWYTARRAGIRPTPVLEAPPAPAPLAGGTYDPSAPAAAGGRSLAGAPDRTAEGGEPQVVALHARPWSDRSASARRDPQG
jgi:peptidoglycan/LPS O-acetylase OafA/YrhL